MKSVLNTWVAFTTFLGCLSCISVTKKCYQIGFLKVHRTASSLALEVFGYIPGISIPQACSQGTLQRQMCKLDQRNNKPHQKC